MVIDGSIDQSQVVVLLELSVIGKMINAGGTKSTYIRRRQNADFDANP
jgi:hypothetical protein